MFKKMLIIKQNKGVTIVALIIAVIILLILSGIVITALSGNNSIIKKSVKARDSYNASSIDELIQFEIAKSYDSKGYLDRDLLKENLKKHLGIDIDDLEIDEDGNWSIPVGDIEVTLDPEKGTTEPEDKTQDRPITVYFAYYLWSDKGEKRETIPVTIVAGDSDATVNSPKVTDKEMMINGQRIEVTLQGWSKSEDGSTGIVGRNGDKLFVTKRDDGKTFYMIYTYEVTAKVPDKNGDMQERVIQKQIGPSGNDYRQKGDEELNLPEKPKAPVGWGKGDDITPNPMPGGDYGNGVEFAGWTKKNEIIDPEGEYKDVDLETDKVQNGDEYYPKFKRTINIALDVNGGERENIPESLTGEMIAIGNDIVQKAKITIPEEKPVREGYDLLGWYDKQSTEYGQKYECGQEYDTFEYSMTLYAMWKDTAKPIVEIDPNGKEEWQKECSVNVTVGDNEDVKELTLKYLWNQDGETELNEESFKNATEFTTKEPNEQSKIVETIESPEKPGDNWYLWIFAKDKVGNAQIIHSNVFWIDKVLPEDISKMDAIKITTNSITVEAQATTDEGSGVEKYLFSINTAPDDWKEVKADSLNGGNPTYTFKGLTAGQTYTIKVKALDFASNETKELEIQNIQVKSMPQAEGITLSVKKVSDDGQESDWTDYATTWINNKQIKIYATRPTDVSEDEFILQYKAGESEYTDYADTGVIVENNMNIKLRVKEKVTDSDPQYSSDEKEITIDHLDRAKPNELDPTFEKTTNSITVSVPKVEDNGDAGSNKSGMDSYIFQINDKEPIEIKADESQDKYTQVFDGLTYGTDYTVKVTARDVAGNSVISETTQTTQDIPDLSKEGVATFEYNPDTWNNHDEANVKINIPEKIDDSLKLQYKTSEETNTDWQDYVEEGFTITKNGLISARIIEKEGTQTGKVKSDRYNFFDRKNPTITIQAEEPGIDTVKLNITDCKDEPSAPDANDASGIVNEKKYTYYQEEVNGAEEIAVITTNDESYTYNGLIQGKEYKFRVEVQDKAGNKAEASTTVTTKKVPDLNEEGAVDIKYVPSTWTTEDVKATIMSKYSNEGYKLQYKQNTSTWKDYEQEEINFTDNGSLSVRLKYNTTSGEPQYGERKKDEVTWIDRVDPELTINEIQNTDITTNSIAVSVEADDALSGLRENTPINYYIIEGEVTDLEEIKAQKGEPKQSTTDKNYTYVGLKQNTAYTIVVEAIDKAENTTIQSKVVTTGKVPDLVYGADIKYTYNPAIWTNTPPVTVTMQPQNNIDEGYTLQYATSASGSKENLTIGWTDYNKESGFKVDENCTIYARLKEKNGEQVGNSAEQGYSLIDIENPTVDVSITSYTTNSVTAEATASEKTPQSGLHETERYQFSIYEGTTAEGNPKETKTASTQDKVTFTGLKQEIDYTVKVVAKDNAGNTGEATDTQKTEKVPDLLEGDITFVYDTPTWTNKESVNVTLNVKETVDLNTYKLQYQTTKETDTEWHDYADSGFPITVNGTINARLIEKEGNQTGSVASGTYTYFDRTPPTITKDDIKITDITSNSFNYSYSATDDESGMHLTEPYRRTWYTGDSTETGTVVQTHGWETKNSGSGNGANPADAWVTQGAVLTVKVEAKDKAGNIATEEKTWTQATIPDLSTSGFTFNYSPTEGNWTNNTVTVKCTPDYLTDAHYKLQLSTDSKKTWEDYTNAGYTVSTNEKVYARLKERYGEQFGKAATGEVTWIDKSGPTISELQGADLKITDNTITVTVKATDNSQSGINRYEYYLNDESKARETHTKKDETDTYTYSGLNADTSYNLKIKVIDELENSSEITKSIKTNFQMEKDELKIGDYVIYEPSGGSSTYESTLANNGYGSQTISRETLNWRVLKIGTGENGLAKGVVKIISDPTTAKIAYRGAEGYNNAVYDLNKMCETLYSHGTTKARSVNMTDFEDEYNGGNWKTTKQNYVNAGKTFSPINKHYPNIFKNEAEHIVDGETGTLKQSEQDKTYSGTSLANSWSVKYTYYDANINQENFGDTYKSLSNKQSYWLASRFNDATDTYAWFRLWSVSEKFENNVMYSSAMTPYENTHTIRAIVELPANVQIVRGKNSETSEGADSIVWENTTLDKSIIYVDSMNERSKDYYGSLKSSTLNYGSSNVPAIYQGNNKELEYDSEGALILDADNAIPYYTVDSGYSLNEAYSVSTTVKCDPNQMGDSRYPGMIFAISENVGTYVCWLGMYNGYINICSYSTSDWPGRVYESSEPGFMSTSVQEYANKTMNIQVTAEAGGETKLYINGELKKTCMSGNLTNPVFKNLTIGDLRLGRNLKFTGKLYDFAIYDSALSEDDVRANWNFFKR